MKPFQFLIALLLIFLAPACSSGFSDDDDDDNKQPTDTTSYDSPCPYSIVDTSILVYSNALRLAHVTADISCNETTQTTPSVNLIISTSKNLSNPDTPGYADAQLSTDDLAIDIFATNFPSTDDTYYAQLVITCGNTSSHSATFKINFPTLPSPDPQELQAVDLGLSVLWATTNLGAATDTAEGNHYAWGEIAAKKTFTTDNYAHAGLNLDNFIADNICATQGLDAALAAAGDGWRLPTYDEVRELYKSCSFQGEKTSSGKTAMRFTASNGNSIILPCAGIIDGRKTIHNDEFDGQKSSKLSGYYMTGTIGQGTDNACCLRFNMAPNGSDESLFVSRDEPVWRGFSIRAVKDR